MMHLTVNIRPTAYSAIGGEKAGEFTVGSPVPSATPDAAENELFLRATGFAGSGLASTQGLGQLVFGHGVTQGDDTDGFDGFGQGVGFADFVGVEAGHLSDRKAEGTGL